MTRSESVPGDLGLKALHYGLIIKGKIIAPPSQFALATIGQTSYQDLKSSLNEIIEGYHAKDLDLSDCPMLERQILEKELSMNNLRIGGRRVYDTQKIITEVAASLTNAESKESDPNHSSVTVKTREPRIERKPNSTPKIKINPDIEVHVSNPTNMNSIRFAGATEFVDWSLDKGSHWHEKRAHERKFLEQLPPIVREQLQAQVDIIDYARATSLLLLQKIALSGDENLIMKAGLPQDILPFLPFDFNIKPSKDFGEKYSAFKHSIETYLLRTATDKMVRETINHPTGKLTLAELDLLFHNKSGFITSAAKAAYIDGGIKKGAIIHGKKTPNYNWAIIQAIENYYASKGRSFAGHSAEFLGYKGLESTSIVFEPANNERNFSMRIVLSPETQRPYILYKKPNPTNSDLRHVKIISNVGPNPGQISPMDIVNMPSDTTPYRRGWLEPDWYSNTQKSQKCLNMLVEPYLFLLQSASRFARNFERDGIRGSVNPYDLQDEYKALMKERSNS
jgi:hypothetical protein